MGRATIISGGTDGLYTVDVDYGETTRDAMVFVLDQRIAELAALISEAAAAADQAAAETAAARELANLAVQEYAAAATADPGGDHSALVLAVTTTTAALSRAAAAEAGLKVKRDLLKVDQAGLQKEKGALESALVRETKSAWCVDLTESAGGAVATIDIPGEDQAILLAPGCRAPTAADGKLLAREVMSPAQAFFNAAILPGWQKWTPTYRKATITAVTKTVNFCDVVLDAATSSANALGVNQVESLTNVQIVYMTCHAEAFSVADRVVVEFVGMAQEWPRVIGFVDHPKSCEKYTVTYSVRVFATPATGMQFSPAVVIANNMETSFSQLVPRGADCDEVSLLNCGLTGNEFDSWSDGIVSTSRHDLAVLGDAEYIATIYRTPVIMTVSIFFSWTYGEPWYTYFSSVSSNPEGYDILAYPTLRSFTGPLDDIPADFLDFSGEIISLGAMAGSSYRTISFVIVPDGDDITTERV